MVRLALTFPLSLMVALAGVGQEFVIKPAFTITKAQQPVSFQPTCRCVEGLRCICGQECLCVNMAHSAPQSATWHDYGNGWKYHYPSATYYYSAPAFPAVPPGTVGFSACGPGG